MKKHSSCQPCNPPDWYKPYSPCKGDYCCRAEEEFNSAVEAGIRATLEGRRVGNDYEEHGPLIERGGEFYREHRLK